MNSESDHKISQYTIRGNVTIAITSLQIERRIQQRPSYTHLERAGDKCVWRKEHEQDMERVATTSGKPECKWRDDV